MKNIEKYTNTKAALEAYNKLDFKKVPFDMWLELEYEEPREQTLLEAAEAIINEWYYTQDNVTLNDLGEKMNDLGEKMVDLKKAIKREKAKPVRNFEKYKTNDEAFVAYTKMCDSRECKIFNFRYCGNSIKCVLAWLYAEAEKEVSK